MKLTSILLAGAGAAVLLIGLPQDAAAKSSARHRDDRDSCNSRSSSRHDDWRHQRAACGHSDCRGYRTCRHVRVQRDDRHDRYDRYDRHDHCDRRDCHQHHGSHDRYERRDDGHRSGHDVRRDRDWGPLEIVHFAVHVLEGLKYRDYDCGCRDSWRGGYTERVRVNGRWKQQWVSERWVRDRSCDYHH